MILTSVLAVVTNMSSNLWRNINSIQGPYNRGREGGVRERERKRGRVKGIKERCWREGSKIGGREGEVRQRERERESQREEWEGGVGESERERERESRAYLYHIVIPFFLFIAN